MPAILLCWLTLGPHSVRSGAAHCSPAEAAQPLPLHVAASQQSVWHCNPGSLTAVWWRAASESSQRHLSFSLL